MKNLNQLTKKEYNKLIKADLLQVLYPEATGDWYNDVQPKESNLIEEAKKRYPIGTKFKSAYMDTGTSYTVNTRDFYVRNGNHVVVDGKRGPSVYFAGKWSEIIKEEPIKVGEYEVEFKKGEIKVGCKTIPNNILEKINDVMNFINDEDIIDSLQLFGASMEFLTSDRNMHPADRTYNLDHDDFYKIIEKLQD